MTLPVSSPGVFDAAELSRTVRIPADVDRDDRILAGLTARQLAILATTGLGLYVVYAATRALVPVLVFVIAAVPVMATAALLALGHRDGTSLDRLLAAALRQRMTPRLQVAAPDGIGAPPSWLTAHATNHDPSTRLKPTVLHLPARTVETAAVTGGTAGTSGEVGVIDLGADGLAAVAVVSTVNFSLRTPHEQEALVAAFGRYLHSLTASTQILIRTQRLDLSAQIDALLDQAGALPHPALEAAAREHAEFLTQLGATTDLLTRQVLLVMREPTGLAAAHGRWVPRRWSGRRQEASAGDAARHAAETRLTRRMAEASSLLAAAGLSVTPLDGSQATAVLASACNPDSLLAPTAGLAASDEVITTPLSFDSDEPDPYSHREFDGHDCNRGNHDSDSADPADYRADNYRPGDCGYRADDYRPGDYGPDYVSDRDSSAQTGNRGDRTDASSAATAESDIAGWWSR